MKSSDISTVIRQFLFSDHEEADKTRPKAALNSPSTMQGHVCRNADGAIGNFKRIALPLDEVEGTGSFNTDIAGNYACITENNDNEPVAINPETGEETVVEIQEEPIVLTQKDLQDLPLKPAELNQDQAPHTLKNYNTNIYATAEESTHTRDMSGQNVEIKATPISYTFDYGDGTVLGPVSSPGYSVEGKWDVKTPTSHQYKETGDYNYSVTTIYRGEYRVDGGPWQVIDGTASVSSDPELVRVWRVKVGNVAGACVDDPEAWGCSQ